MNPQQRGHARRWIKEGWTRRAVAARLGVTLKDLRGLVHADEERLSVLNRDAQEAWQGAVTDREKEIVWANYGDVLA
jgi:hypothetical protein